MATPAMCRRRASPEYSSTLDVAASLSQARRAASAHAGVNDLAIQQSSHRGGGTGAISLTLFSRDFLFAKSDAEESRNYSSLAMARLHRDEARVSSLTARVSVAVARKSSGFSLEKTIRGPIVSGISQGSGEYFSRVGMGTPARNMYMVVDTGSDVTWVQCQPCADYYRQTDPVFDPSASSTYSPVPCGSEKCRSLDASGCHNSSSTCIYQVGYGDGSYTVGDFATESLTLGTSSPVGNVAFGCGHDNEGLFAGAAGLLALGGGHLSFPSQISARAFSYCLVDRDSPTASTLEFRTTSDGGENIPEVIAPLLKNQKVDTFYYVGLRGISVGGVMLQIPESLFAMDESGRGGVIIDSGTAITRLPVAAYAAMRDAFVGRASSLRRTNGFSLFDTCYNLTGRSTVQVPAVAFHFTGGSGAASLRLPAKNYVIPVDTVGTYCLAFAATNMVPAIIGNVQQQGIRVSFDMERKLIGFAGNKC